jgi:O-antigen/teichoic acid export membrane protein
MKAEVIDLRSPIATPMSQPGPARRARSFISRDHLPAILNTVLSIGDQAIVSGTSFATAIIIGRASSRDQLGLYYLTLTVVLVLITIQQSLVSAPYAIFCSHRKGTDLAEYTGSVWVHHVLLIIVSMLVMLVAITALSIFGSAEAASRYWVLPIVCPMLMLREAIRRLAFARLRMTTAIAIDATVAILQLGGLLTLWYLDQWSIATIFGVMSGACAVACIGWLVAERKFPAFDRQRFLPDWRHNWSFAKWVFVNAMIIDTIPFIIPWIVDLALGATSVGLLMASTSLVGIAGIFVLGLANFVTPKAAQAFASGGISGLKQVLAAAVLLLLAVFGVLCSLAFVVGDPLVVFVYGDSFSGQGAVLLALAVNGLAGGLGMIANTGLWVINRPRENFLCDICMVCVTFVAALLLVFRFGVMGAAIATLLGTTTGTLLRSAALYYSFQSLPARANAAGDSVIA